MVIKKMLTCKRCDYSWKPRKANPKYCPKCNSPYWDKMRQDKLISKFIY